MQELEAMEEMRSISYLESHNEQIFTETNGSIQKNIHTWETLWILTHIYIRDSPQICKNCMGWASISYLVTWFTNSILSNCYVAITRKSSSQRIHLVMKTFFFTIVMIDYSYARTKKNLKNFWIMLYLPK